jgi:hypothetical protein
MKTIDENKTEVAEALDKLHAQVTEITTGDEWAEWLAFLSKLHNYSMGNRMWMWAQWEMRRQVQAAFNVWTQGRIAPLPGFSMPAAFSFWKDHGRMVRKGEKALTVLAPIVVKDREAADPKATKVIGFKLKARTFDVSQTEGDDLPTNPATPTILEGEGDSALFAGLVRVAGLAGFTVTDGVHPMSDEVNGWCDHLVKTLAIHPGRPGAQRLKTLVHELAHALLHSPEEYARAHADARSVAEVEAESVAYVVMHALGHDTSAYSFAYVASWSEGRGKLVADTAERVLDTADRILGALEGDALRAPKGAARPKDEAAAA